VKRVLTTGTVLGAVHLAIGLNAAAPDRVPVALAGLVGAGWLALWTLVSGAWFRIEDPTERGVSGYLVPFLTVVAAALVAGRPDEWGQARAAVCAAVVRMWADTASCRRPPGRSPGAGSQGRGPSGPGSFRP
jgi:hypothetical protein